MVDIDFQTHKYKLPEGLNDLMGDIMKEVLRAQPENICGFIAQYLGALVRARDALIIAGDVCEHMCLCSNEPGTPTENKVNGNLYELGEISDNSDKMYTDIKTIDEYKPSGSYETEPVYDGRRDKMWKGLPSNSKFSLAGSYMNLPKSGPYSVDDSDITEGSKLFVKQLTGNIEEATSDSDYGVKNIYKNVKDTEADDKDIGNFERYLLAVLN